ncbi:MAG: FtsH protease activity modulator HflK [Spirochaetaceae bacterium]|nr:FtsH protease activity modulator HflK [Spirochaetaceae bacterium]MBP5330041.1 FtsH protease activity modulator HflK [Spirochaetaceae bacterium]
MEGKAGSVFRKIKNTSLVLIVLAAIIALTLVYTGMFKVDDTEQAVITRFGKYYKTVGAGLHVKLPFGIDKSYNVPVKVVQTEQFGFQTIKAGQVNQYKNNITKESTMLTGDLNIVDVEWIIQYRIVDPVAWLFNVKECRQTIRDISQSVLNTLVGDRAILDIMGSERSAIQNAALDLMNDNFQQLGLGITVNTVRLQNIVPPAGVQDAFDDVNKAIQDMNRFINEGKEAYNAEIPKAKGEADQQILIAQGYAAERVNKAKGDVARFNAVYEEYRKAPEVTRERLYLEAMETIFNAHENTSLIDHKLENMLPVKNLSNKGAN